MPAFQHNRRSTPTRSTAGRGRSRSIPAIAMAVVAMLIVWAAPADAAPRIVENAAGDITVTGTNGSETMWVYIDDGETEIAINHSGGRIEHTVPGPRRNITVRTAGGDDQVNIDDAGTVNQSIPGNLTINTGSGSDVVNVIGRFDIGGRLNVSDGAGYLRTTITRVRIDGSVTVAAGSGESIVRTIGASIDGSFTVRPASSGSAELLLRSARIDGNATLLGTNNVDSLEINGSTTIGGRLSVDLRGGDDRFQASGAAFERGANIRMGNGSDTTMLFRTTIDGRFSFSGQGGDDSLLPTLLTVNGPSILNGGSGHDLADGESNTFSVRPRMIGFEVQ